MIVKSQSTSPSIANSSELSSKPKPGPPDKTPCDNLPMMQRAQIPFAMLGALAALPGLAPSAFSQNQTATAERFRQMSKQYEAKGLAEPFRGIATKAGIEKGLYS